MQQVWAEAWEETRDERPYRTGPAGRPGKSDTSGTGHDTGGSAVCTLRGEDLVDITARLPTITHALKAACPASIVRGAEGTVIGKIGTTVFIFTGLGIFALAIQQFGHFALLRRRRKALEKHLEKRNDG